MRDVFAPEQGDNRPGWTEVGPGDFVRLRPDSRTWYQIAHPGLCGELLAANGAKLMPLAAGPTMPGFATAERLLNRVRPPSAGLPPFQPEELARFEMVLTQGVRERIHEAGSRILNSREVFGHASLVAITTLLFGSQHGVAFRELGPAVRGVAYAEERDFGRRTGCWLAGWFSGSRRPAGSVLQLQRLVRSLCAHSLEPRHDEPIWLARLVADRGEIRQKAGRRLGQLAVAASSLLLAGQGVIVETLATALELLIHHPDGQESAAGSWLPASQGILAETLRWFPAQPLIARKTGVAVSVGGHEIPARSVCLVPVGVLHRDPRWFDHPLEFRPARFLPMTDWDRVSGYYPLGHSPLANPVWQMVMLGGAGVLAHLLREWRILPVGEPESDPSASSIECGCPVRTFVRLRRRHER